MAAHAGIIKLDLSDPVSLNVLQHKEHLHSLPKRKLVHGIMYELKSAAGPPWQGEWLYLLFLVTAPTPREATEIGRA